MYRISGVYSNQHKDRAWAFKCTASSIVTTSCSTGSWWNSYQSELLHQCPNGVIAGNNS